MARTDLRETFVLDGVRTPFGRLGGALAGVRPDDLAAHVLRELLRRSPGLDPADVDDVVLGAANQAGEDNRDVARMAVLLAGMPTSVPGTTVNRLCGSGMEAVVQGRRAIAVGDAELVVAGGAESMSRAPWVVARSEGDGGRGGDGGGGDGGDGVGVGVDRTMHPTALGWRLVNPAMPARWTTSLGAACEHLADLHGIGREEQDAFAVRSHRLAHAAWEAGVHDDQVVPVPGTGLVRDESIRPTTSPERLAQLAPVFRGVEDGGTITAGNASPLNDGASALLLGTARAAERIGRAPLARIVSSAVVGVDPDVFGTGPVQAARTALARAGTGFEDLALVELNEAFAVQSLACLRGWPELDPEIVNTSGGALALGHPLGASGGRVVTALARGLAARGGGYGLAAICIGVGQGLAVVLEA